MRSLACNEMTYGHYHHHNHQPELKHIHIYDQYTNRLVNHHHNHNGHQRLSSSFKDAESDVDSDSDGLSKHHGFGIRLKTKNFIKIFKSRPPTTTTSQSCNSSFVDEHSSSVSVPVSKSKPTEKLSKKFLNLILARHSTVNRKPSSDEFKIPLPKSYSFKPVIVSSQSNLTLSIQDLVTSLEYFKITIRREPDTSENPINLGFTVVGYCPCQVSKVENDSIAQTSGLMAGDLIIKINGKNVSRATCDSIVKLIK